MSFNTKTQFGTVDGAPVNLASIQKAQANSDKAHFDLLVQLGYFGLWVDTQKGTTQKEQARLLADKLGYKATSLEPMISNGKAIVENNATPQKVEQFKKQCKAGKVSTKDGRQARASLDNFAKHLRGSNLQGATPKKGEQVAPIVDDEKHADYKAEMESKESKRTPKVNPFTSCEVGKGDYLFTLKMPKGNSDKALQNFRELCAKVEAHYGWTEQDVYPTLQKVNA
jgi:hypothetical protein